MSVSSEQNTAINAPQNAEAHAPLVADSGEPSPIDKQNPDAPLKRRPLRGRPSTRTPQDDKDHENMRAYQKGDIHAFQDLVARHEAPLYRFCLRSLGDKEQAADATQEVFMRIVKHAAHWEPKAKFTTWMYTIARNYCIDETRKARFRRTDSLNETLGKDSEAGTEKIERVIDENPDATRIADSKRMRQVIDQALAALPEEQRMVFCLREYGGQPFKDIAHTLNVGENTIKSRMRYALSALRDALLSAGFHAPNSPHAKSKNTGSPNSS